MKQLWAPWRMDYISQPDKEEGGCFLCRAARSEQDRELHVLWRGEHTFCILNRWPYNNGHLMVAPLKHTADLSALSDEEMIEQVRMLRRCRDRLEQVLRPGGFNIGLNLGEAAGAGLVGHLHWHIVPRWNGDTNFMPVLADTKVIPQSLDRLWELLHDLDDA